MSDSTSENAETHLDKPVRSNGGCWVWLDADIIRAVRDWADFGSDTLAAIAVDLVYDAITVAELGGCTCGDATIPDREHFYDGRTCHDLNFVAPDLRQHTRVSSVSTPSTATSSRCSACGHSSAHYPSCKR